jgi:hypothetical protein
MRQRHVEQSEQQHEAGPWQSGAERKAERDGAEQQGFERPEFCQIGWCPFDKAALQGRHEKEAERLDQPGQAIGGQQRGGAGGSDETAPAPRIGKARLAGRGPQHRFRAEKPGKGQAEHEAAVQIDP